MRFKVPAVMGSLTDYPPGSVQRAQMRAALLQSQFYNAMHCDLSAIECICGDNFLNEEPWQLYQPNGRKTFRGWVELVTGEKWERVIAWIRGYSDQIADKWESWNARTNPLADGPGKPEGSKGANQHSANIDNVNKSERLKGGNDTDYTLRRLARDKPELLDKIESGELSVNAAAIQAGIRKKKSPAELVVFNFRKCENRLEPLRQIVKQLEPMEHQVLKDWLEHGLD